jgi:hypothetical protein
MKWRSDMMIGLGLYLMSSIIVQAGFRREGVTDPREASFHFDGGHYFAIAETGYQYDPTQASNVAFFPAYPLLGKAIATLMGCAARTALWIVSQISLVAAFTFFAAFLRTKPGVPRWPTLFALALWPPGVCFHVGYSESLLLAVLALLMLGFAKNWPPIALAIIAGATTGIRAVGVAASIAVIVHISMNRNWKQSVMLAPLAAWGLIAFIIYQAVQFGEPLAFMQTQRHWSAYVPENSGAFNKSLRLMILEPIWGSFAPSSTRNWTKFNGDDNPLLGSAFWNPILFLLAGLLVLLGWFKRWLSHEETILGTGLLAIPYVTRADEQSMLSHARFAAVVLPMYIVMGELLARLPLIARLLIFGALATGLGLWALLFAADAPLL